MKKWKIILERIHLTQKETLEVNVILKQENQQDLIQLQNLIQEVIKQVDSYKK